MTFALPESYTSYVDDPAVNTAVEHILGGESLKVPETLEWNQLPDFHAAVLAAHQVRCEYASALQGLWDAVWQRTIDGAGVGEDLEAWSITDTAKFFGVGFDTESLFQNGMFARAYTRGEFYIGLGVSLDLHEARLIFWFGNENNEDHAADLLSWNDWDPEMEDYGYWSKTKLARIEAGGVPLKRLNAAAAQALAAITV